jgi:hypothetical protein
MNQLISLLVDLAGQHLENTVNKEGLNERLGW